MEFDPFHLSINVHTMLTPYTLHVTATPTNTTIIQSSHDSAWSSSVRTADIFCQIKSSSDISSTWNHHNEPNETFQISTGEHLFTTLFFTFLL